MTSALERLPKHTIKLTVTLTWPEVKSTYEKVLNKVVNEAEVAGFRKGKAPRELVEKRLDKTKLYEEVLKETVPKAYSDALKEHSLSPIVSPRISVLEAAEGKNWQFQAVTCLAPVVILKDYRSEIAKLKGAKKIWVPGKDLKKQTEEDKQGIGLSEVLKVLLNQSEIEIPNMLVEDQVNKKLSDLIDQVKQLGMTVEQYLLSKGLTSDTLRAQYAKEALDTLKLEFILEKVADAEKIIVSEKEIEEAINKITDSGQKEALQSQKYYIGMLLRRQKTLDTLTKPIV